MTDNMTAYDPADWGNTLAAAFGTSALASVYCEWLDDLARIIHEPRVSASDAGFSGS